MPKIFLTIILFAIIFNSKFLIHNSYARTTPADIINAERDVYNQRLSKYSPAGQQKITHADKKIAQFNADKTALLENIMIRQGEILDEYIRRKNITIAPETDGIHRRDNPFENARYWVTYTHEAVAYQAAHIYIINLTGEANMKSDINSEISALSSDLNTLKTKVLKSQNIIANLVK